MIFSGKNAQLLNQTNFNTAICVFSAIFLKRHVDHFNSSDKLENPAIPMIKF